MFKKLILAVVVICMFVFMTVPVMAADLKWSADYSMNDNINVIANSDNMNGSAGVFMGTIGEVRLDSGKKVIGLGGASFHVGDSGNMVVGIVPVTLFDDVVQLGIAMDMSDFRWNDPEDYLFSVGFSASGLVNKLWQ